MLDTFGQDNPISFKEEVAYVQWTKIDRNWSLKWLMRPWYIKCGVIDLFSNDNSKKRRYDYTNNIFPSSSSMTRTWILFPHHLFCYCLTAKLRQKMTSNTLDMELIKGTNVLKQIHNKCFINTLS